MKNASELLFERYLGQHGVAFEYEPDIAGKTKHPDYLVRWNGLELVCEVKGLHARRPHPARGSHVDPYQGIRKEIHEARRQFKEYREFPCVLVIHNVDDWELTDWPYVVFGAMLGNFGIQIPFDDRSGRALTDRARLAFLSGGKMIDPKSGQAQNTTISAIALLSEGLVPNSEFEVEYKRRVAALASEPGASQTIAEHLRIREELRKKVPRALGPRAQVEIFENPLARRSLHRSVFAGPYDARIEFNESLGQIVRVFAGPALKDIEAVRSGADVARQIERFAQEVVARFLPQRIVLFGSHAYGSPQPDSDVDILVVFPGKGDAVDRSLDIRKRVPCDFPLDLLTRSAGEIERRVGMNDPFILEILQRGKVLYEAAHA